MRAVLAVLLFLPAMLWAGEAEVVDVKVEQKNGGLYKFEVSVSHPGEDWEHYVDVWEIVAPDGTVLGSRTLIHPHPDEQPFTRNLVGVRIPAGVNEVTIRTHDTLHGYSSKSKTVSVPR